MSSGDPNDEKTRRQGQYNSQQDSRSSPASQSRGRADQRYDNQAYTSGQMQGKDYLGSSDPRTQLRDPSFDGHDSEADLGHLSRQNSRTPLTPPPPVATQQSGSAGYFLPPGATQPSSAAQTPTGNPVKFVHYPPSPQLPHNNDRNDRNDRAYTSIPLNDTNSPSQVNEKPSGSRSVTPQNGTGTGTSTPRRRPFSFLPMQDNNYSTQSIDSSGLGSAEKKKRPKTGRSQSWDLLGERPEWEEYNPSQAKDQNLRFAEGDVGTNKFSRFYYWALNSSIIVRWIFYIVPVLAILWIPGIIALTGIPSAVVWEVGLLWWSIWLSVLWGGFWASTAAFLMLPGIWRTTIGSIVPSAKKYTDVIAALGRYAKLIPWAAAVWISFTPLIINHYGGTAESTSRTNLTTMVNILFGLFLCSIVLGIEKLIVQLIALQFHQDSYADRLTDQKFQIRALTTLYMNSHDIPGRSDTLTDADSRKTKGSQIPKVAIRKALRGLREVAQTTTTALGNVASEMAGQSVLQTNSPANKVTAALSSANKSKALARRLFYSFRAPGAASLDISDIARFFPDLETANSAFAVFDVDGNGDATRDELESSVLALHRERLSLEASMRDLDGAVRRLDDIFMVFVFVIVVLILAAMVTTRLTSFVTSAGTFVLGLSWLIGSTMQEILLACIFLFVKHPYDVGDRVDIDGNSYTVAKMQLLSTNFKRVDGKFVWIGHNILATKIIENVRRSGPTSESFSFEVAFDTTFEALQSLRGRMLIFVKENARDYLPIFDVIVDDIPGQSKMVLKADIKYKSNWQQGALKVQRRNKWICALKMTLADLKIWGPAGAGDPAPAPADPVRYTMVPWEEVNVAPTTATGKPESPPPTFHAATTAGVGLMDRRQVMNDTSADIWGEDDEASNFGGPTRPGTPGTMTPSASTSAGHAALNNGPVVGPARARVPHGQTGESIEMTSAPVARRQ